MRRERISMPLIALTACALVMSGTVLAQEDPAAAQLEIEYPPRPELTGEAKARVEELDKRIDELYEAGLAGEDRTAQDAALAEAITLAEEVLAIRLKHQGPGSPAGAKWIGADGEPAEWYEVGDARRRVESTRLLAALSPDERAEVAVADTADSKVVELHGQGEYDEALALTRRALEIYRRVLGDEHPNVARGLNSLAYALDAKGDYASAEPLYHEALAMSRRLLGDEHPDVAHCLHNLVYLLNAKGDYASAELLCREALAVRRKLLGDEHPDAVTSLSWLAYLLDDKGDYAAAEPLHRETLAMKCKLLGDEHPDVAMSLNNLAGSLYAKGDYASAEPLYREALAMNRKLLGDEHPNVAMSLNNLAALLQSKGDYASAEPLHREALAMRRKLLGDEHPDVPSSLSNLASLLRSKGDYASAEPLYSEALAMSRKLLGNEHPLVARGLNNLALLLQSKGDYASAEPLYREALAMNRKLLGDEHPDVAMSLNNLALLLQSKGDYASAEPLYREALAMRRKLLGDEHPDVATSLNTLAFSLNAKGDYASAERILEASVEVFEAARLKAAFSGLERSAFGERLSPSWRLAGILARSGKPGRAWQHLEQHLARGLLDQVSLREARPMTQAEAAQETSLLGQLGKLDERIASLASKASKDDAVSKLLKDLKEQRNVLQAEFLRFEQQMEKQYGVAAGEVYALAQIRNQLPGDAALVAWLDIKGEPKAADPNGEHWACIVKKTGSPIWVKLPGSDKGGAWGKEEDALPSDVRVLMVDARSSVAARNAKLDALRRQRVAPLEQHLDGIKHLVVLPAGVMSAVPVEMLTDDYTISYAPSGSMFAWLRERATQPRSHEATKGLLALGDPVFATQSAPPKPKAEPPPQGILLALVQPGSNADSHGLQRGDVLLKYDGKTLETAADLGPSIKAAMSSKKEIPIRVWRAGKTLDLMLAPGRMGVRPAQGSATEAVLAMRRMDDALVRSGGSSFPPLPGTRKEVQTVSALFGNSATTLLGSEASEQKLAELAASGQLKRYRYLHFATHGVLDNERAMNSALILAQDNLPDPFEQYMAGKPLFDGRLTARQIVQTWKLDADLVTLSACQTALGKQAGGEGMIGFSQVLFAAGARSLVLSLWKVSDEATCILMEEFYRNLLERKLSKAQALREAKRTIRKMTWEELETRRANGTQLAAQTTGDRGLGEEKVAAPKGPRRDSHPFEHPHYWAAFILIGSPD